MPFKVENNDILVSPMNFANNLDQEHEKSMVKYIIAVFTACYYEAHLLYKWFSFLFMLSL